ncbi:hypothetical protein B7R74_20645 [Yersinia pseudotuberculosis]|nr:hypothetical protein B7R74_20645 [Yersinia pseudotuberculosis]
MNRISHLYKDETQIYPTKVIQENIGVINSKRLRIFQQRLPIAIGVTARNNERISMRWLTSVSGTSNAEE